jgi:hypothetical protein
MSLYEQTNTQLRKRIKSRFSESIIMPKQLKEKRKKEKKKK